MKIYRLSWYEASQTSGDDGCNLSWHSSRAGANAALAQLRREGRVAKSGPVDIQQHEIELTRTGLLKWLNLHFTTDNG